MNKQTVKPTLVELPFPSVEDLMLSLPFLLSPEGLFIETAYPPALGTRVEMVLQTGQQKEETARFEATVIAHKPSNPVLSDKKGVQLEFNKLHSNAIELFSQFTTLLKGLPQMEAETPTAKSPPTPTSISASPPPIPKPTIAEIIPGASPVKPYVDEKTDPRFVLPSLSDSNPQPMEGEVMPLGEDDIIRDELPPPQSLPSSEPELKDFMVNDLSSSLHEFTGPGDKSDAELSNLGVVYEGGGFSDDLSNLQGQGGYDMSDVIFGIDLGTCYSCVSVMKDGNVKVLADEKAVATIPSVVSYTQDGKVIVGREAQQLLVKYPRTTIYGAKRFIGRNYHSPVVQKMIQYFPYKIIPDEKNHPAIDVFGKSISLDSVSAEILKHVVSVGQSALGEDINKVIITVPAYYSDNQRAAVKNAGVLAGLNVVRIINEPTAAALAFGFNQKMNKRILVYDLGGGTFDISILDIKDNAFKVVATGGDTFLGGEDFDNRMVKWVLESSRDDKIFLARNAITFERVKQACEYAKRELSDKKETSINLPYMQTADGKSVNFQKHIERPQLVQLTRDLVEKTLRICDNVLIEAKLNIADIDEVVLVGGMTRMPFVRNSVHQHYGKKPFGEVNPDEAVSRGAALLGGEITGKKKVTLSDVLSMSIGIGLPRNRFKPILAKNTPVPCVKKYKINADLSADFSIDVFQGDSEKSDNNEYLGTLVFSDEVKPTKEQQSLEISFELSAECLLSCTISNPQSGKSEKALLITHDTPPSAKLA